MRRWAILTLALVIVSLCLVQAYAATYIRSSSIAQSSSAARRARSPYGNNTDANAARTRSPYGATSVPTTLGREPMDPNKVRATIKMFQGLDKELEQAAIASRNESTEWLKPDIDNKARLAGVVQRQVSVELELIRKIALEEGARKTVAAIDGLLLDRETRLGQLVKKMEEEKRATRTTTRTTRGRTTGRRDTRRRSGTGTQSEVTDEQDTNGTQRTTRRRR